jgi:enterochelin esterase-like enzyme
MSRHLLPAYRCIALSVALAFSARAETEYPLTEDSKPNPAVPKGELLKLAFSQSKIFPGTTRDVTIYIPRQYDGARPACVYVNQDGVQWNAPVVFDNLIAKGEMPVTIGVFVTPGVVKRSMETLR